MPYFWSALYAQAWRRLQNRLGQKYDPEPLIAQISNTSCTSDDDEPNAISRLSDKTQGLSSIRNLHAAGYTDAAFQRCMLNAAQDYAAWKTTPVNFSLGPIFLLDRAKDFQPPPRDAAFTVNLVSRWRAELGARGILANHNMSYPLNKHNLEVYEAIRMAGPPIEFQTHSPDGLDWPNTIKQTVCLGGHSLEIWNATNAGGYVDYPVETLISWANELKTTTSNELCPAR
jgi:hypothetical protein